MSGELLVLNRQRRWAVDRAAVEALTAVLLDEALRLADWRLGITLVGAPAMARLNRRWLQHEGSTDIITFDHRDTPGAALHGELFISVDDTLRQAREFGVSASLELMRYVIHGVLHLEGYDDLEPAARRRMKREENRWVRWMSPRLPRAPLVKARRQDRHGG